MSQRYLGGIITANQTTPTLASASGVWTLEQQFQYASVWQPANISRSVRLRSSASAYFNRTPANAGNRKTWTWSGWVKRGALSRGVDDVLFDARSTAGGVTHQTIHFVTSTDTLRIRMWNGSSHSYQLITTQVFRDPSAWYHVVVAFDSTQATDTNRVKLYINGVQVSSFSTASYPSLNLDGYVNDTGLHNIGTYGYTSTDRFDGYMTEVNFIDGQALTPSSFGALDSNGVWQPLTYTGTYGTNGFYLNFSDNSGATATTIGKDYSGNGNNWTPNNISVTAGVTYDSMLDVPTLWADGGNGRGNYPTINPLWGSSAGTISAGNLNVTQQGASVYNNSASTMAAPATGYWYAEFKVGANVPYGGGNNVAAGIVSALRNSIATSTFQGGTSDSYGYLDRGGFYNNASLSQTAGTYATGDTIMVALGNGKLWFGKNGVWQGTGSPDPSTATSPAFSGLSGDYLFGLTTYSSPAGGTWDANFGQRPFSYTPPTGFVALNTQNLPTPTISNGANYMAATLYTGNGATQSITNTVNGVSFQPDFVWMKSRSTVINHVWYDSVRGVNKILFSSLTNAEFTDTDGLMSFNSSGYTLGAETSSNNSGTTFVGWQWKAGGTSSSNTNGSITSTVSVGATQGFSVVTYTGTGANATVGHGLGVAPKMIICKGRSTVDNWLVYHASLGNQYAIYLNLTNAQAGPGSLFWNSTSPTSSVFSLGGSSASNTNGATQVAYCFSEVAGFSKFGSYTGNGSADGPFVYCGFRPRWIMIKRTDTAGENWEMWDSSRGAYNIDTPLLYANLSNAETSGSAARFDALSNGLKIRSTNAGVNASAGTYIYACFAENPFKTSRAR